MDNSIKAPVSYRQIPEPQQKSLTWAQSIVWYLNKEIAPLLREMRTALTDVFRKVVSVQTTDATATTIWSATVKPDTCWDVEAIVTAYQTNGNAAAYRRIIRVKRIGTSAPTSLGSNTIGTDREDVAGWDVSLAIDGNTVRLQVTGAASATIDWSAEIRIHEAPRSTLPI